jgi:hypothetical protein
VLAADVAVIDWAWLRHGQETMKPLPRDEEHRFLLRDSGEDTYGSVLVRLGPIAQCIRRSRHDNTSTASCSGRRQADMQKHKTRPPSSNTLRRPQSTKPATARRTLIVAVILYISVRSPATAESSRL